MSEISETRWCEERTQDDRPCSRTAGQYVGGKLLCFQHARSRERADASAYAEADARALDEIRDASPFGGGIHWSLRLRWSILEVLRRDMGGGVCLICGKKGQISRLTTSPITLRRSYIRLCKRRNCSSALANWEGMADVRRRRAQYDWERQNPEVAPLALIAKMPPQYPSISRATLRAFLDSGADVATVEAGRWTVTALNGSIKRLGFSDQVFAEQRSGQAVLRRVPADESTVAS